MAKIIFAKAEITFVVASLAVRVTVFTFVVAEICDHFFSEQDHFLW